MLEPLVLGSLVVGKAEKEWAERCKLAQQIGTRYGLPLCICGTGSGACRSRGKRVRFRYYPKSKVFRVVWRCDKGVVI